jgi:hypothetical protein
MTEVRTDFLEAEAVMVLFKVKIAPRLCHKSAICTTIRVVQAVAAGEARIGSSTSTNLRRAYLRPLIQNEQLCSRDPQQSLYILQAQKIYRQLWQRAPALNRYSIF